MNAIITGASKGIGKAIAEKFAANGFDLVLCARNEVMLYHTMEELMMNYPSISIKAKAVDLGNKQQAIDFGAWLLEKHFIPDVLVNNAGQFLPGNISDEEDGVFENMLSINLASAYHLTRRVLPAMIVKKSGHIFNICSIASLQAYANGGSYSISKFALLGFSKNLREELKPHGIKVTAVVPGAIYTDSWKSSGIPESRMMEVQDIASMVYTSFTLSPQAVVEDIIMRPQKGDL